MAAYMDNLQLLEKIPSDKLESLLHQVIDGICGHCRPRLQDYGKIWTGQEWLQVVDASQAWIKHAVKNGLTKDGMEKDLDSLPAEIRRKLVECVTVRRGDIRDSLLADTAAISQAYLKDFDWKLKLALSSDKIASVQEPLLTIDFNVQEGDENKRVSLEMDRQELSKLIASLETANKAVLQLKT
ncbi:COMM domain-containing protein 8-like [Acanthaster planci]|uniref:COMM domain-containing protein 8-like n=1 Tax=Acanthaster planci TaxID=133434 RepID=A0A8B7ZY49_ACAPL|nr:COMM domain-containing protein 8-like [Acanthaster planci]